MFGASSSHFLCVNYLSLFCLLAHKIHRITGGSVVNPVGFGSFCLIGIRNYLFSDPDPGKNEKKTVNYQINCTEKKLWNFPLYS